MSGIDNYLEQIKTAVYGKDVRNAIYEGVKAGYNNSKDAAKTVSLALPSGKVPVLDTATDYNTIYAPGEYKVVRDTDAALMTHLPTMPDGGPFAHKLIVMALTGAAFQDEFGEGKTDILQLIIARDTRNNAEKSYIYRRLGTYTKGVNTTAWGDWVSMDFDTLESEVSVIESALTEGFAPRWTRETVGGSSPNWSISSSTTRCLSSAVRAFAGDVIESSNDVVFRMIWLKNGQIAGVGGQWFSSYTVTDVNLSSYDSFRLNARIGSGSAEILPEVAASNVSLTSSHKHYARALVEADLTAVDIKMSELEADIEDVNSNLEDAVSDINSSLSAIDENVTSIRDSMVSSEVAFNLNIVMTGSENMMQSFANSFSPMAMSHHGLHNRLYFGFTTGDGYSGVGSYDYDTREVKKTLLKRSDVDDHNMCAVHVASSGRILVACSYGHNTGTGMFIRRSRMFENIELFEDAIEIPTEVKTTYAQMLEYNETIYLFYRSNNLEWWYSSSSDEGLTWSSVAPIITNTSTMQYYCRFQKTTVDGVIRMCMYSNPMANAENNIRMGFLHLSDMSIYNADNTTRLGYATTGVNQSQFTEIIFKETTNIRMFDVAITDPGAPRVLWCKIGNSTTSYQTQLYIYDSGRNTMVPQVSGTLVWSRGTYPNGAMWFPDGHRFVYAYCSSNNNQTASDFLDIWDWDGTTATKVRNIAEQKIWPSWIGESLPDEQDLKYRDRLFRPVVDCSGEAIMWTRGLYDLTAYVRFNMDLNIYCLDEHPDTRDPVIVARPNGEYECGVIDSLDFTPCTKGRCRVIFQSGSLATELMVPNTVVWPSGFSPNSIQANTVYEITVRDGKYATVNSWG